MDSVAPVTSLIHKTRHKSFKSQRHHKWASMHIYIAWQIYIKEQQKKSQLKSRSLPSDLDTQTDQSVIPKSPHRPSVSLHHPTTDSRWDRMPPDHFIHGKGNEQKLVRNFITRGHYIWKPHERKRHSEYLTLYPNICRQKRQKQQEQDDLWSHATFDKKAVFYSSGCRWYNNLQRVYSPTSNPMHLQQSVDTYVKLEGSSRSPYYPQVLIQDFKHKSVIQAVEQNCYAPRLYLPPASYWAYDNCLFGSPNLRSQK